MTRPATAIIAGALVAGCLGAVLWAQLAEPSNWQVADGRIVLTEEASRGDFEVLLVFLAIGAVVSTLLGLVLQLLLRMSWVGVVSVAAAAIVASLITWRLGIVLGPPDPSKVEGLQQGDLVPQRLGITSIVPFFVWPMGALLGILIASWFERDRPDRYRPMGATTAWSNEIRS